VRNGTVWPSVLKFLKFVIPDWSVYILRCGDGSLYTGVTNDVISRIKKHNAGQGAAYTRSHKPVSLVYQENHLTRSQSLVREAQIKKLSRTDKQKLIVGSLPETPSVQKVQSYFRRLKNPVKAKILQRFFKTGPGQYGEGDRFLGITVPVSRRVAQQHRRLSLSGVKTLLQSPWHEERLLALLILVERYKKSDPTHRSRLFSFYARNLKCVNNWDLVDVSAPVLSGDYFLNKDTTLLWRWAKSSTLWERRAAIVSTWAFIRQGRFDETLSLAPRFFSDKEDLMHKATGWMLREVGKKNVSVLENFLNQHAGKMPRTMLRYSLEKFPPEKRQIYLDAPRVTG